MNAAPSRQSVSFDRAAETYDATRALPDHVAPRMTEAILAELAAVGAGHLLDVGVGTGRIARPLAERGVRIFGLDIAPRMLERLRAQLGQQHVRPDIALADATRLPVAARSFRAVLVFHLLHLVSPIDDAIAELRRVLAPGGIFMNDTVDYLGFNPWDASIAKWSELLRASGVERQPRVDVRAAVAAAGAAHRAGLVVEDETRETPRRFFERTRDRIDSWSWEIPDDLFAQCLIEYEAWCGEHYGDLDREYVQQVRYELDVWTFD